MEQNLEDQTAAAEAAEAAPVRRRASRRVSAAAGAAPEVAAETVSAAPETAAVGDSEAAPATQAAPKRASRARKKVEPEAAPAEAAADPAAEAQAEQPAEAPKKRATRARKTAAAEPAADAAAPASTESGDSEAPAQAAPVKRTRATSAKTAAAKAAEADATAAGAQNSEQTDAATAGSEAQPADAEGADAAPAAKTGTTRTGRSAAAKGSAAKGAGAKTTAAQRAEAKESEAKESEAKETEAKETEAQAAEERSPEDAGTTPARRTRRRATQVAEQGDTETPAATEETKEPKQARGRGNQNNQKNDGTKAEQGKADAAQAAADKQGQSEKQGQSDKQGQNDRSEGGRGENGSRSSRTRQRDRKRRGGEDLEPEITEDDVLLPVAGILDVLDNYAFVRTSGYLPGVSDVYVALGQVKKYNLRRGDAIVGAIRQPREGEGGGRQKYNAIVKIESVNGKPVEETEKRPEIANMTAIFPEKPLRFSTGKASSLGADIDKHAPMGLGQRAIVALPAAIPATRVLSELAAAVTANAPDAHLLLVLTNARPEEATHLQRTVNGEVITATFDRAPEDQATIAELALDRAARLVELGHDVVVLMDSLTDLTQAYLQSQQNSRATPEALQTLAVAHAKRLLGSARNLENGGSLTLLATARTHTGVAGDKDLLRALVPAANSFVKISGSRTAPEVNTEKSYTLSF